ncbi:isochorismate synthase MenF [Azonexus sp. IMCC34842]|uniref:isochorismate synthase n=1 Tax=Azonexus sp. IMCC34842 TaxID=3420950 RepID=UPI003D112722
MIDRLRRQLATPELLNRLHQLAGGAPAAAPLSLHLDLGKLDTDWQDQLPGGLPFWYRALPARNEFRLGIGHAFQLASAGANRFAALDSAFAGLCQHWRHERRPLAFAGFAFDATSNGPLPNALLAVPAILLECIDGACSATLSVPAGRIGQAVADWQLCLSSPARPYAAELLERRPETLAERAWVARVNIALRDIAGGRIDKLVLARSRKIKASRSFSPAHILGCLVGQQPDSLIYAHGNGQQTFLGATPERLVRLADRRVDADALAGTAWPGSMALAEQKNRREQAFVVHAVCTALAPLCLAPPEVGAAREHPAGELRHLRSRISATVKTGTTLFDLVRTLHPTPAVGGFPAAPALDWLSDHQEQRQGWYSGGFGQLSADGNGEFSVALRSVLLDGNTAELQAGAGIVAGSDAWLELAETEAKLGTMLAALSPAEPNGIRQSR